MADNPIFPGFVNAAGFQTPGGMMMIRAVKTNGTTDVNVFGATNGFGGSIVGVKVISRDTTAAEITVWSGQPTFRTEIIRVKKDSGTTGAVTGSAVASGSFIAAGTVTVVSNSAGEALVELTFVGNYPS